MQQHFLGLPAVAARAYLAPVLQGGKSALQIPLFSAALAAMRQAQAAWGAQVARWPVGRALPSQYCRAVAAEEGKEVFERWVQSSLVAWGGQLAGPLIRQVETAAVAAAGTAAVGAVAAALVVLRSTLALAAAVARRTSTLARASFWAPPALLRARASWLPLEHLSSLL